MTPDPQEALRQALADIEWRLDAPPLGNPKYAMDRRAVEGELRSWAREALSALAAIAEQAAIGRAVERLDMKAAIERNSTGWWTVETWYGNGEGKTLPEAIAAALGQPHE